jgi:hypothetical protein
MEPRKGSVSLRSYLVFEAPVNNYLAVSFRQMVVPWGVRKNDFPSQEAQVLDLTRTHHWVAVLDH